MPISSTHAIDADDPGESHAKRELIPQALHAPLSRTCIVAAAVLLAWATWGHWGDIQIDCGRELYVPLEVLRGKLVYRDFWYPYGPLMPYVEAGLVAEFGRHLAVFYLFGIAVTIAAALLLFEIGRTLAGVAVGVAAALVLVLQSFEPWAFNFIFPYSYAATAGLTLGLLCVLLTLKYIFDHSRVYLSVASLTAGLALICKQEVGIAGFVMIAAIVLIEASARKSIRLLFVLMLCSLPGVILSAAVYGYFFVTLTPAFVLENWLGPPGPYFAEKYGKMLYAGFGMRFQPREILVLVIGAVIALRLWYWLARLCLHSRGWWPLVILASVPLSVRILTSSEPWTESVTWHLVNTLYDVLVYPRAMYFIAAGYLFFACYRIYVGGIGPNLLGNAAVSMFAITVAIRVIAQVTLLGYSVYYGTVLFLIFLLALNEVINSVTAATPHRQKQVRNMILAAEVFVLAILIVPIKDWRTARLETSWGTIYLSPNDATVASRILNLISEQKRLGKRVVLMPESPMIYAFSDTEAPGRWYTLLPGFLSNQEEQDYVRVLRRDNPDYVIVTARNFSEYGSPRFGIDFDRSIFGWVATNYQLVGQVGDFPKDDRQALAAHVYYRRASIDGDGNN